MCVGDGKVLGIRGQSPPKSQNFSRVSSRYDHNTLLNALWISRLRRSTLRECRSASCMMLEASLMLSVICLVGINPVWSGEIKEVMIFESLSAKNVSKDLQIGVDD